MNERYLKSWFGFDPGGSGSIVCLDEFRHVRFIKANETEQDICNFFKDCLKVTRPQFAMLEHVHSSPQMGVKSAFTFGQSYGFMRALLAVSPVPWEIVSPKKWQDGMRCRTGGDKNVSKAEAQRLFPGVKIIHANADALLIAEYCRRVWNTREGNND